MWNERPVVYLLLRARAISTDLFILRSKLIKKVAPFYAVPAREVKPNQTRASPPQSPKLNLLRNVTEDSFTPPVVLHPRIPSAQSVPLGESGYLFLARKILVERSNTLISLVPVVSRPEENRASIVDLNDIHINHSFLCSIVQPSCPRRER